MNFSPSISSSRRPHRTGRRRGFSLVEVIVVVGLMSFIVLGLVMMFGQTQRAYKLGTTQVDVLEGGRATIDMIGRELAVITPSRVSNVVNFYADIPAAPDGVLPLKQVLPGFPIVNRTNVIDDFFFLTRENQAWKGIGYHVGDRKAGAGTLYRYEMTTRASLSPEDLFANFFYYSDNRITTNLNRAIDNLLSLNISRLVDGVVHLRVRPYDASGFWMTNRFMNNISLDESTFIPGEIRYFGLYSNLVPATVELELGILEDAAYAKAKAIPTIPNSISRSNYLSQQASRVQLFRLRVPVRNVDPTAFQ